MIKFLLNKIGLIFSWITITVILCAVYYLSYNCAEPKAYDFMTKNVLVQKLSFDNHKQVYGSDDIVLVVIDAKSTEKYRWPWKRELYCNILKYFSEYARPKVIVHDSILTTPDRDNPESDRKYFNSVKNTKNYIAGFMPDLHEWRDPEFGKRYDSKFKQKFAINIDEQNTPTLNIYKSLMAMPDLYFNALQYVGCVAIVPGAINGNLKVVDEIYRNTTPLLYYKENYYPSLSLKTFMFLNNINKTILTNDKIIFPEMNYSIKQVHNDFFNTIPIKYYKLYNTGYSHNNISAIDIMQSYEMINRGQAPIISPEVFKDKIVILGANVPAGAGLNDNKNSPVSVNHPGVDIQATAIDNLVHNDFLCVIPQIVNFLITLILMISVYLLIKKLNLIKSVIAIFFLIFGYLFICTICFYYGTIINVITPVVMLVISIIFAYTNKYVIENRNKEKVKSAMGKYMSQNVMQRVVENIDNLGLGGKRAVVTVLFADIRGFTSMSEKMSAQQVSEFLNEYFSEMEPIITSYNGIINKFIGDAIMAIFGEPIQDENHAQNAVKCAYAMLQKVEKLHKKWYREGKPEIEIGIGINTGEVFVGNIGSENRMEYTVIGDTVNLASRLESYNKMYKTKMLISASTYKAVKDIADIIKIPEVQIRGKANKIDIYEVLKVKQD